MVSPLREPVRARVADYNAKLRYSNERNHTRSTKLSTMRFSPAVSNCIVSLLLSIAVTLPLPNF